MYWMDGDRGLPWELVPAVIPKRKKMTKITKQVNAFLIYITYFIHFILWFGRFLRICTCFNSIWFFFFGYCFDYYSIHGSSYVLRKKWERVIRGERG